MLLFPTKVAQRQVDESKVTDDNLTLLQYDDIKTLEDDLNYLRSVLKQLKGTPQYDTPLGKTLEAIRQELENASLHNAELTGTPTATTPPTEDISTRIATTEYVNTKIDQKIVNLGADARYVHMQGVEADEWRVRHELGKRPSVTVVQEVDGGEVVVHAGVFHIDENECEIYFAHEMKGKAYFN